VKNQGNISNPHRGQYIISIASIVVVSAICFFFNEWLGYKIVALILLVTVSILAALLDIIPLLIAALLSALIWNFFFIPPVFTFHIGAPEDLLMFLMYFFISMINAILTSRIRKQEIKARDREEKEKTIALYNTVLTSLSHELRTPISTMIGAVDTLKDSREELSAENKTNLLDEIDLAAQRLNRQVENLLNISRLESGTIKLHLDWCDINELIWTVLRKFENTNEHSLKFSPGEIQPLYKLDAGLMEQAIHNLVHNAIQHTPPKTYISIHTAYENECCMIYIADNGGGIIETDQPRLFQKFFRAENAGTGGTGLGLSIVKGIIEAHNGTIRMDNNPNSGATFTIAIPAETSFINYLKNE
jgi:two-component system sensor histidine kinase KdpD